MTRRITPSSSPELSRRQPEDRETLDGDSQIVPPPRQPTPIDPFKFDIKSWDEWETQFNLKRLPPSFALTSAPKVDFFSETPLTFSPQTGPINLFSDSRGHRESTPVSINPFDGRKYKNKHAESAQPIVSEEPVQTIVNPFSLPQANIEGGTGPGIQAPPIRDNEKFEFDWPSEEIRLACEALFVKDEEWKLPALNWIPMEDRQGGRHLDGDTMTEVQNH